MALGSRSLKFRKNSKVNLFIFVDLHLNNNFIRSPFPYVIVDWRCDVINSRAKENWKSNSFNTDYKVVSQIMHCATFIHINALICP